MRQHPNLRDPIHYPSYTVASRFSVFHGASGLLTPLKDRKVIELETIFGGYSYSVGLLQSLPIVLKILKDGNSC